MKSNFKYIIVAIIGSLTIVLLVQIFWLRGLYNSIESEAQKMIVECIDIANSHELEFRMDSIESSPKENKHSGEIIINQSFGDDKVESDTLKTNKVIKSSKIVQKGDTIENSKEELVDEKFSLAQLERLGILIRETLHQTIDPIAPIQLDTLHAALLTALETKKIETEVYKIESVNLAKDSVMQLWESRLDEPSAYIVEYIYDNQSKSAFRIYLEPLTKTILGQMLGILASTALIILILAFAFWYLIRIIFQQKTLEEMKDDFTNNMTHELKTPIAVAYSATDALLNFGQGENKERREKYLTINKEQLENLSSLVEQILSMSMERRLKLVMKKEYVNLRELIENLVEQHRMKTKRELTVSLNINPYDLEVYADKTHLHNVISNLIDNAIKYSKDEVTIAIEAYVEGKYNVLKIKDCGIGIASDKQKFLFEKFYRVPQGNKHNAKGYGIGLFYVKTIVDKHGGSISVESAVGKGSEFTLKIPVEQ